MQTGKFTYDKVEGDFTLGSYIWIQSTYRIWVRVDPPRSTLGCFPSTFKCPNWSRFCSDPIKSQRLNLDSDLSAFTNSDIAPFHTIPSYLISIFVWVLELDLAWLWSMPKLAAYLNLWLRPWSRSCLALIYALANYFIYILVWVLGWNLTPLWSKVFGALHFLKTWGYDKSITSFNTISELFNYHYWNISVTKRFSEFHEQINDEY